MDDIRTVQKLRWGLIWILIGNFSSLVGLVVDLPELLGVSEGRKIVSYYVLASIVIFTSIFLISQIAKNFFQNTRKINVMAQHTKKYINYNLASSSDEIHLIYYSKKLSNLSLRVKSKGYVNNHPSATQDPIELKLDKGYRDGFIVGLNLAIYENHQPEPLFNVELVSRAPTSFRRPVGVLRTDHTLITFLANPLWGIDRHNLKDHRFVVRVIEPQASSTIIEYFSVLLLELDRDWTMREIFQNSDGDT